MEGIAIYFQDFASVSLQYYKLRRSCVVAGSLARTTATATRTAKSNWFRQIKQQLCTCITLFTVHFSAVAAQVQCETA